MNINREVRTNESSIGTEIPAWKNWDLFNEPLIPKDISDFPLKWDFDVQTQKQRHCKTCVNKKCAKRHSRYSKRRKQ